MQTKRNTLVFYMIIVAVMMSILGFAVGVNAFFIPFVKEAFRISTTMSYLIMTATYSAYLIFGLPSGIMLRKAGYKGGMAIAFIIIGCGFFMIAPAGRAASFPLFLLALFVNGMGQTLLTGSISTYVSIMGPAERAAKRMSIMGVFHKLSFAGASFILSGFMDLTHVDIEDVIVPFSIISGILLIVGVLSYFSPLPEIKEEAEGENVAPHDQAESVAAKTTVFQFPHLFLGFMALFLYMGIEVIALGTINDYATVLKLPSPANYVWLTSTGMVLGYLAGIIFIPAFISQRNACIVSTFLGVLTTLAIYILPPGVNIYLVALLGLANSLLYPAIWPLAIANLGRFTKTGTSILVMGITGAAFIPLIFGYVVDLTSYPVAYLICLPAYLYIFYYAYSGSKIRT